MSCIFFKIFFYHFEISVYVCVSVWVWKSKINVLTGFMHPEASLSLVCRCQTSEFLFQYFYFCLVAFPSYLPTFFPSPTLPFLSPSSIFSPSQNSTYLIRVLFLLSHLIYITSLSPYFKKKTIRC